MGLFDRWFGTGVTDPTVAARQRSAAWGAFLAQQRAALPPRPVDAGVSMATAPAGGAARVPPPAAPAIPPSTLPASALSRQTTTVLVIEDGEEEAP